ncbi:pilus assembly PilX family protein [Lysobacter sp. CA199]|uniref:pilus assembly PilX family protein n=1 Tax=Lysobacter sp. CA199 TaxID=3455608 RepID=UPI003F8D16CB
MNRPRPRTKISGFHSPAKQRGAALYVALMMLILLSLIGVAALQVTGLQERMSSNYRSTNMALQNVEALTRERELDLDRQVNSGGKESLVVDEPFCTNAFDPTNWAAQMSFVKPTPKPSHTRRIDECVAGNSSTAMGTGPVTENTNLIFQITAYATDRSSASNPSSDAVIDTIFIP